MDAQVQSWMARDPDPATRAELAALVAAGDTAELARRFAGRLRFGTAGLRAPMGAGPMRMGRLVVRQTCAGLAAYLAEVAPEAAARGVLVGFDGRHNSRRFAEDAARVLATAGLTVTLFDRETPTPVVGFWQLAQNKGASVVITASHNPPRDNGIKIYWTDGAQIVPPHDAALAAAIAAAAAGEIACRPAAALVAEGRLRRTGAEAEAAYLAAITAGRGTRGRGVSVAYTPLHGVGARLAEAALRQAGCASVHTVASQREPDGAFPTVRFPNPEEPGAMDAVLRLAARHRCALACANDPDADRLAAAVRLARGGYRQLTGDELGILIGHHLLARASEGAVMASTIVSSRLLARLAADRGVNFFTTLTGFKWIAHGAQARAERGQKLLFAYEEALGYSVGDFVWDKDGISTLVVLTELAAACAAAGETLIDRLATIMRQYGLYRTGQRTLASTGSAAGLGARLRERGTPTLVAGRKVEAAFDLADPACPPLPGEHEPARLPPSDVLIYHLHGDARVIVRPSGTEPKIKCYYEVVLKVGTDEAFADAERRAREELRQLMDDHQRDLAIL